MTTKQIGRALLFYLTFKTMSTGKCVSSWRQALFQHMRASRRSARPVVPPPGAETCFLLKRQAFCKFIRHMHHFQHIRHHIQHMLKQPSRRDGKHDCFKNIVFCFFSSKKNIKNKQKKNFFSRKKNKKKVQNSQIHIQSDTWVL